MSRKTRFMLALAIVAGVLGWRAMQHHAPEPAKGPQKPVAKQPAPERTLGRIVFHPCTLTPPLAGASVEAQCGTLSVAENPGGGTAVTITVPYLSRNAAGDAE